MAFCLACSLVVSFAFKFFEWCCHDTSVSRLTRVRAQQQASSSVLSVCIVSHVAACAPFFYWGRNVGRVLDPWLLPRCRDALDVEVSFLDSGVQTILEVGEGTGDELASGLKLRWAAQVEFPSVVRLVELECRAVPLAVEGGEDIHLCSSSSRGGFWNARRRGQSASHWWTSGIRTSHGLFRCGVHRDSSRPRRPAGTNH